MKNLYNPAEVQEVKQRVAQLRPESPRLWGTMTAPQAMAHCCTSLEMAVGDKNLPRVFAGRLLGWIIKPLALKDDAPMRRNSPTMPELIVRDDRDFDAERTRL